MKPKEITSLTHPAIKHLVKLRTNRNYRYQQKSLLLEGVKLLTEVGKTHSFQTLLALQGETIPSSFQYQKLYFVSRSILEKVSGTSSPESLIAEISLPIESSLAGKKFLLILEEINDPGNLGTLIRTALGLGFEGVFITNTSCDPFNDKALRAAKGAIFFSPFSNRHKRRILGINQQRKNYSLCWRCPRKTPSSNSL